MTRWITRFARRFELASLVLQDMRETTGEADNGEACGKGGDRGGVRMCEADGGEAT